MVDMDPKPVNIENVEDEIGPLTKFSGTADDITLGSWADWRVGEPMISRLHCSPAEWRDRVRDFKAVWEGWAVSEPTMPSTDKENPKFFALDIPDRPLDAGVPDTDYVTWSDPPEPDEAEKAAVQIGKNDNVKFQTL